MAVELLEPRLERLAVLLEVGGHGPVFLRHELPDFLFAFDDQPQRHRLHTPGRQTGLDALPEHRRCLVADQAIQHAPRLLGVDLALVDIERVGEGLTDGVFRDFVEQDAADLAVAVAVQLRRHVPGDRLPFAIRVGGEQDQIRRLGRLLDVGQGLRLFLYSDVFRREPVLDVDAQLAPGQIAEMPHGRLDRVAATQVLADCFRLGRGLDNDECAALCRSGVGFFSIRRRESFVRDVFLSRRSLLFWFHFFFVIRHLSTSGQRQGLHLYQPALICASFTTSAATFSALFASVSTVASALA